jgi:hypothetical protein
LLDALKFAFEILVVGALTLPWIATLHMIFAPRSNSGIGFSLDLGQASGFDSLLAVVPKAAKDAVSVAVVIAFGYLLGSAVSRISKDFFNDEMLRTIPSEDKIRDAVYFDEYCSIDVLSDLNLPSLNLKSHPQLPAEYCPGTNAPAGPRWIVSKSFWIQRRSQMRTPKGSSLA